MGCHLLALYESTTTTVSAKNLLYCFPEEKKSLTSWMAWRGVSKLTANFHFWVNYPFNIFIWPEIFQRGTQNCGSPFPLSQVLQPWPIYHATTCHLTMCVVPSLSSEARDRQQKLICKGPAESHGVQGDCTRDPEWKWHTCDWEYHVESCWCWKWAELSSSCSPWSALSLQTFTADPLTWASGCSWTTERSWEAHWYIIQYSVWN